MTKKQEENRNKVIEYLESHIKMEYKEEHDWSLDHKWLEKYEIIEKYYAIRAIDIALGLIKE